MKLPIPANMPNPTPRPPPVGVLRGPSQTQIAEVILDRSLRKMEGLPKGFLIQSKVLLPAPSRKQSWWGSMRPLVA